MFKLYQDKNSALKKNNRYTQGGESVVLEKRIGWWERRIIEKSNDDIKFIIEKKHERRADKISNEVYGKSNLDWLVLQYNNIVDINEELITGKELLLPSPERVLFEINIVPIRRIT